MTLPQDTRAPHRQQRWIELQNFGSTPIPPFGALEIVQSTRPEIGGYTPLDGRTVLQVRRSLKDNPCGTVINGPCEILPGLAGRVGTMDDPMLALVYEEYDPGTVVGVKTGSFLLEKGYCGYLILGDYDSATGTMRVKRWEDCPNELMVRAVECIKPGEFDKAAQPQKWNAVTRCWVDDPNAHQVYICDCNKWLLALPNECFKVERIDTCNSDTGTCYRPSFPYGLTRRVRIENPIYPGQCGDATILKSASASCSPDTTICQIRVCNSTKRKIACDTTEDATLHINPGECGGDPPECYGWLVPDPRANLAVAKAAGEVCGGAASITGWEARDVCVWDVDPKPTSALNPAGLYACIGDDLILSWDDCNCAWMIIQVKPHVIQPVLQNVFCDGCGLSGTKTKSAIVVQQCTFCEEVENVPLVTGVEVDVVEDLTFACDGSCADGTISYKRLCLLCTAQTSDKDDKALPMVTGTVLESLGTDTTTVDGVVTVCSIVATKATYCWVGCLITNPSSDAINFTKITPATDIVFSCDPCPALDWDKTSCWALCVGSAASGQGGTCECVPCDAASGTPSSTPSESGA